jgi:RNA polymerase sigma-70 factor (ECF subfamily)
VSPSRTDDAALMHLIAQGDECAFSRFYERHKASVYGLVGNILREAAAAEETTLDVFVQIWQHAPTYRAQTASVRTWLLAIARHKAIDRLRRSKVRLDQHHPKWVDADLEAIADADDTESAVADWEQRRRVIRAIGELPEEQKRVLGLAYFKGYSHSQIAESLALPLGTVKTRIRAAMQQLKAALNEE